MKVSKLGPSKGVSPGGKKRKASAAGEDAFADHLRDAADAPDAPESAGLAEGPATTPIESILAVQEAPDATEERSRGLARQYGDDILDRLEALRHDLLIGAVPKDRLADLAQTVRAQRARTSDPRLRQIIDEIDLRAKVEIAKLTRET